MTDAERTTYEERIATLEWRLAKTIEQHDLAEQDIAHKRRQIAGLKTQLADKRAADDPSKDVRDIFDYWVVATQKDPQRTKLNQQRKDAVRKALREGYSVEDIQHAVAGMALDPFRKNGVTYDGLHVACRNVELYRDKYHAYHAAVQQSKRETGEKAKEILMADCGPHYSRPHLPALWRGGLEAFATALHAKGCRFGTQDSGHRLRAQCPACMGDNAQALSVIEADDGRVLATCFTHGCTWEDICSALGVESRVFGPRDHPTYGKPTDNGEQIGFGAAA